MSPSDQMGMLERIEEALKLAAETFGRYEDLHREKNTDEGNAKAYANAVLMLNMEEALAEFPALRASLAPSELTEEERAEGRRLLAQIEGSKTCADWGAEGDATRALERWMVKHAEALLSPAPAETDTLANQEPNDE